MAWLKREFYFIAHLVLVYSVDALCAVYLGLEQYSFILAFVAVYVCRQISK